jgi:thiamine biosynthesis lipoprotein
VSADVASTSFPALGTNALVAMMDRRKLPLAKTLLAHELALIDTTCSRFRADSELAQVNAQSGSCVPISALLVQLVRVALRAADATNGIVDPTLGSQLRAAGYDRTFELVRKRGSWTVGRVEPPKANWLDVELDDERQTLLVPRGVELDLGATAKGWAADHTARRIAAKTDDAVLVALGGDVAVADPATTGRPWPVRIADDHNAPLDGEGPVVEITAGGLATSGTAVRRWATDHGEAHHLLDPRTGRPAVTPWRTMTVAAATCLDANVASTAAVVLGGEGARWLEERRLPARAVRHDGSVVTFGGWPAEPAEPAAA